MTIACDRVWRNARLATLDPTLPGLGVIEKGLIAAKDGRLRYVGPDNNANFDGPESIDCEGRWITPGLVDCHTHLVYGGNRADEFEKRLDGVSYEEIARSGGGILSTMRATRAASEAELVEASLPRLDRLLAEGVTTVEIKSGYGLSLDGELKLLRAARALGDCRPVTVSTTLLAAHAVPPEYRANPDAYVGLICDTIIPAAVRLADAVDGFCETIAFSTAQIERVFTSAKAHGLPIKLHAEQLSNQGGAALAARHGAWSADHLEYLDQEGARALQKAGTVAVLLPGAFYFTRETTAPPVALLRQLGIPIALATDCNPGTSPLTSPLLVMNMAATLFRMTVTECLIGFTRAGARALGRSGEIGSLEVGKNCDLAIWEIDQPADLVYRMGFNPLVARVWRGQ